MRDILRSNTVCLLRWSTKCWNTFCSSAVNQVFKILSHCITNFDPNATTVALMHKGVEMFCMNVLCFNKQHLSVVMLKYWTNYDFVLMMFIFLSGYLKSVWAVYYRQPSPQQHSPALPGASWVAPGPDEINNPSSSKFWVTFNQIAKVSTIQLAVET